MCPHQHIAHSCNTYIRYAVQACHSAVTGHINRVKAALLRNTRADGVIHSGAVRVLLILLICLVSFPSDWSCIASLCVMAFGTNRGDLKKQSFWLLFYVALYAVVYFFAIDRVYGILQMGVALSLPVLRLYNGQRGKNPAVNRFMKWFFYLYYPAHLLLIGLLIHV